MSIPTKFQAALSLVALLAVTGTHGQALSTDAAPDAVLERAYWQCMLLDSQANARGEGMDLSSMASCAAISKDLQTRRFGGDFGRLHEWTTARKLESMAAHAPSSSVQAWHDPDPTR